MKRLVYSLLIAALLLVPSLAAAQAPAQAPEKAPAAAPAAPPAAAPAPPAAPQAPQQPQMQCVPGPGGTCVVPGQQGQMSPEQMKQMQAKCCAMMQEGKGCPMHQQMQKQVDELRQRVEALEKQKGKKK